MLVRSVEARQEALPLLLARQVQEKLENDGALPSEVILEMRDVEKPLVPDALAHERRGQVLPPQDFRVHAYDEDLFVVGSVEDSNQSALGQAF